MSNLKFKAFEKKHRGEMEQYEVVSFNVCMDDSFIDIFHHICFLIVLFSGIMWNSFNPKIVD